MKHYFKPIRHVILTSFLVFILSITITPQQVLADIGGLTKCSDSAAFSKRLNTSVKKLEQRLNHNMKTFYFYNLYFI